MKRSIIIFALCSLLLSGTYFLATAPVDTNITTVAFILDDMVDGY